MSADQQRLNVWLGWLEKNRGLSLSTVRNYRHIVGWWQSWLADQGLDALRATPERMHEFAGPVLHKAGLRPAARRVAVAALRGYYKWLVQQNLVRDNIAGNLPYPQIGRPLPRAMPLPDAERLLAQPDLSTFKGVRDVAILAVLIGCGLRVSGLCGINEEDLLFDRDEKGIESLTLRVREKGRRERYMPVPDEARLLIRAYLGHPDLEKIDRRGPNGTVLFVNMNNHRFAAHEQTPEHRRVGVGAVEHMITRYGRRARIDPKLLHPHSLRHLYGAELAEDDVPLLRQQLLMGHADPKNTAIYAHIAYRKLRKDSDQANPLGKMKTPATGLAEHFRKVRAAMAKAGSPSAPGGATMPR